MKIKWSFLSIIIFIISFLFYLGAMVDANFIQKCDLYRYTDIGISGSTVDHEDIDTIRNIKLDDGYYLENGYSSDTKIPLWNCLNIANKFLDKSESVVHQNNFESKYPNSYLEYVCSCETSGKFFIKYSSKGRQYDFKSWKLESLLFMNALRH